MSRLTNTGGSRSNGDRVDGAQSIGDAFDLVVERQHVEIGAQRRDLDRDVADVRPAHPGAQGVEAAVGLGVAEDRLTQQVDVDREPGFSPSRHVTGERRIGGGDDHAAGLAANSAAHDRRNGLWRETRADGGKAQRRAVRRR